MGKAERTGEAGGRTYEPTWSSLALHPVARWFRDAKFGIYAHWGPYSVPAYGSNGTWYPHRMYRRGTEENRHHLKNYGPVSSFGYKDFIPLFKAERFDPDEWAELFLSSGARFAGPVAEHHDGFSMWASRVNPRNASRMGPQRDVVGELEKAVRKRRMRFLTTFHHAHNWWFFPTWDPETDCSNPEYAGLYTRPHSEEERPDEAFLALWKAKLAEVINGYRPDMLFFDFGLGQIRGRSRREAPAFCLNKAAEWGGEAVVAFKEMPAAWKNLPPGVGVADLEVGKMNELTHHLWMTDTSIDCGDRGTWSHVKNVGYKSPERLIHNLVDRVSKNGCTLLNVGPRADGTIPERAREILLAVGRWLAINGEAIYDTTPWVTPGEGPTRAEGGGHFNEAAETRFTAQDIRFTTKGGALYAVCLGVPGDEISVRTLKCLYPDEVRSVSMLGVEGGLRYRLDEQGLTVETPRKLPGEHAFSLKISG